MDRIKEIRARVEKASKGPWKDLNANRGVVIQGQDEPVVHVNSGTDDSGHSNIKYGNLEFITHAREDIPYLLTAIAAVEKEWDEARTGLTKPNMFNDAGCQYKCHVVDTLKSALEEIASVPCICEPCYKDRGLIQPDCLYCHVGIIATEALKEGGDE